MKLKIYIALLLFSAGCQHQTEAEREYDKRIAAATDPEQKTLLIFTKRVAVACEDRKISELFRVSDGVDAFEAWLLAYAYLPTEVTMCGDVGVPRREGTTWIVPTYVGREARLGKPITIDAVTGRITCEGYAAVEDPSAYAKSFFGRFEGGESTKTKRKPPQKPNQITPNQALVPTATSVTPAADAPVAPAAAAAHL